MRVYVVLLNWNGWRDTIECLESLRASGGVGFTAVVCDNDSGDGSLDALITWAGNTTPAREFAVLDRSAVDQGESLSPTVRLAIVRNGGNLGFAGGNNVGLRLAMNDPTCRYMWLLNNDTVVAPSALSEAVTRADADPTIGLCGSTLVYYHDRGSVQAFGGARFNRCTGRSRHVGAFASTESIPADPQRTEQAMSYVIGAAMLVRREYIEQVGMMQDDYFLYYEEIDWATRGKSQFRLGYAPASIVYHKEGASIGTTASGGSALSMYFLFRNRIRFTARFHAWMLPMVVVTCCWDVFKLLAKGRMTAANAALRGMLMRPRTAVSTRA